MSSSIEMSDQQSDRQSENIPYKIVDDFTVKLVSYTTPSTELSDNGVKDINDLIAFCARVSSPSNEFNTASYKTLIKYLKKNCHWSPFEMANVCLLIESPRDITRQILRHRSFSFQEFSQRYSVVVEFSYRQARLQDHKNRQNSISLPNDTASNMIANEWRSRQKKVIDEAYSAYSWALDNGIAKEQARVVLPEGLTRSRLYMNGTIRSWIHYCQLRCGNGTQKEHMEIAKQIANVISTIFPINQDE